MTILVPSPAGPSVRRRVASIPSIPGMRIVHKGDGFTARYTIRFRLEGA